MMVSSLGSHLGALLELCIFRVLRFCYCGAVDRRVTDTSGMDLVKPPTHIAVQRDLDQMKQSSGLMEREVKRRRLCPA